MRGEIRLPPLRDWTPAGLAAWNDAQRDLASLRVMQAAAEGRRVRAIDRVLASPAVSVAFETPAGR